MLGGEEAEEEERLSDLREADREAEREGGGDEVEDEVKVEVEVEDEDEDEAVGAVLSKLRLRFMTCSPKVVREPTVCP